MCTNENSFDVQISFQWLQIILMRASLSTTIDSLELNADPESEHFVQLARGLEGILQSSGDKVALKSKLFKAFKAFLSDFVREEDAIGLHQFSKTTVKQTPQRQPHERQHQHNSSSNQFQKYIGRRNYKKPPVQARGRDMRERERPVIAERALPIDDLWTRLSKPKELSCERCEQRLEPNSSSVQANPINRPLSRIVPSFRPFSSSSSRASKRLPPLRPNGSSLGFRAFSPDERKYQR